VGTTRRLTGAFPRIGDRQFRYAPAGLPGDPPFPSNIPPGCSFHPRCPVAIDRCSQDEPHLQLFPADAVVAGGPRRQVSCHKPGEVSNADVVVA